jgi:hypothetical protein
MGAGQGANTSWIEMRIGAHIAVLQRVVADS